MKIKSDKEKQTTEIRVVVQPSFHKKIMEKCETEYRTISEVVRELLSKWIKEN